MRSRNVDFKTANSRKGMKALWVSLAALLTLRTSAWGRPAGAEACTGLSTLSIPGTQITAAELIPASDDGPEYCRVVGVIEPAVGFEVCLPTDWNRKLYFLGNFGFGGFVRGDTSFMAGRGYATASTDTGHQSDSFLDASWALDNRPAEIDYGSRAVHQTAVVSKMLLSAYYGEGPRFSYFDGCSKGGGQGLKEAQDYPGDFDGIAAGAPALDHTGFIIAANWNLQALHATETSSEIPPEKVPVIGDAVLASCDGVDGLVDGLIDDPRRCSFEPESLLCAHDDAPNCLTPSQLEALKKIYAGPTDSHGRRLFPGLPLGGERLGYGWDFFLISTPDSGPSGVFIQQNQFLRYLAFETDDPDFDWTRFDFDRDPPRMQFMGDIVNAANADLSGFRNAGGKLILFHGWSDPNISATRTIQYYRSVRHGLGRRRTEDFARLFLAPGMSHCGGGSGPETFDYLTALEGWVESGAAPDSIVAYHFDDNGDMDRSRPLCPFPQVARYKGHGSIDDAENFGCVEPEPKKPVRQSCDHAGRRPGAPCAR